MNTRNRIMDTAKRYWNRFMESTGLDFFRPGRTRQGNVPVTVVRPRESEAGRPGVHEPAAMEMLFRSWFPFAPPLAAKGIRLVREETIPHGYRRLYRWPGGVAYTSFQQQEFAPRSSRSRRATSGYWIQG